MNKHLLRAFFIGLVAAMLLIADSSFAASRRKKPSSAQASNAQQGYSVDEIPSASAPQSSGLRPVMPIVPKGQERNELELPPERHQPEQPPPQPQEPASIRSTISVTATDVNGRWVPNLGKDDITLFEDGKMRQIISVQPDDHTPITLGIVIDTTGSMDTKLPAAKAALSHFVETINPDDEVFIIAFSTRAFLLQDFTSDKGALLHTVRILHANGETALYDAVINGLRKVQQGRYRKKALLVITDGIDNSSGNPLGAVIDAGRRSGVLIYTVGIGTPNARPTARIVGMSPFGMSPFGRMRVAISDPDEERVDDRTLRSLSDETGGATFILDPRVMNLSGLDSHFQDVSRELREQYTVSFAGDATTPGPHKLRLESRRDNVTVRGPKYLGRGGSTESAAAD